jgi:hypothetical protein
METPGRLEIGRIGVALATLGIGLVGFCVLRSFPSLARAGVFGAGGLAVRTPYGILVLWRSPDGCFDCH